MFGKVLVANRGEIALRIFRTCRQLGIKTVAVYSEADVQAPHAKQADEAVLIGPAPARSSYLVGAAIIAAAKQTGAEAIHPGYGFLSESWQFAKEVEEAGLVFVGPGWEVIRQMGLKTEAKALMAKVGVPTLPGSEGAIRDLDEARWVADRIGYPLMLKAAAGGGGIGMVEIKEPGQLESMFAQAQRRVQAAFGDPSIYIEKSVREPRHVEVQVFGDSYKNAVHLFERDCSIQRRHQKLIEESPAPDLPQHTREGLYATALAGVRAVGYRNAGTMEFVVDREGNFYFLEMNTRLQVEHPVTEMVTGLDLVELQFREAVGEPLPFGQARVRNLGHAIECRVYAEDPEKNFLPSPGVIRWLTLPEGEGIRNECGVEAGSQVTPYYDPLLAKLIAWGPDREAAIERMARALEQYRLEGVKTTLPFHRKVMADPVYRRGAVHTGYIESNR